MTFLVFVDIKPTRIWPRPWARSYQFYNFTVIHMIIQAYNMPIDFCTCIPVSKISMNTISKIERG